MPPHARSPSRCDRTTIAEFVEESELDLRVMRPARDAGMDAHEVSALSRSHCDSHTAGVTRVRSRATDGSIRRLAYVIFVDLAFCALSVGLNHLTHNEFLQGLSNIWAFVALADIPYHIGEFLWARRRRRRLIAPPEASASGAQAAGREAVASGPATSGPAEPGGSRTSTPE